MACHLGWRQDILWIKAGRLLIRPWGTKLSDILIKIHTFSFNKMHLKMSLAKLWPFCLSHNELKDRWFTLIMEVPLPGNKAIIIEKAPMTSGKYCPRFYKGFEYIAAFLLYLMIALKKAFISKLSFIILFWKVICIFHDISITVWCLQEITVFKWTF